MVRAVRKGGMRPRRTNGGTFVAWEYMARAGQALITGGNNGHAGAGAGGFAPGSACDVSPIPERWRNAEASSWTGGRPAFREMRRVPKMVQAGDMSPAWLHPRRGSDCGINDYEMSLRQKGHADGESSPQSLLEENAALSWHLFVDVSSNDAPGQNAVKRQPGKESMMRRIYTALGLCGLAFMPEAAESAQTATINVTATVVASCTVSATAMSFPDYSGTAVDATSTITVNCSNGAAYGVEIDAGSGTPGSTARAMVDGSGNGLDYEIYTDTGRATVWAAGVSGSQAGTGTGADQTVTAYGRIPAAQAAPPGSYSDTLTVTVTY